MYEVTKAQKVQSQRQKRELGVNPGSLTSVLFNF